MKEFAKLVVVLTIICMISGSLLAYVSKITEEPIREASENERLDAIEKVLGECDNVPGTNKYTTEEDGKEWTFFVGRMGDDFVGAAFETVSSKGYGGDISIMAGVDAEGKLSSIKILNHKETPGLGAKITDDKFRGGLEGRSLSETNWQVKKDGGDIDQITAATISSRAVVEAITKGIKVFIKHREEITACSGNKK